MRIRLYNRMDLDDVLKLYYDTVHSVCAQDYSLEETMYFTMNGPMYDVSQGNAVINLKTVRLLLYMLIRTICIKVWQVHL